MSYKISYVYSIIDKYSVPLARIARKTKAFERQMQVTNASLRMFATTTKVSKKSLDKYSKGLTTAAAKKFTYGQAVDATNRKITESANKFGKLKRKVDSTSRSYEKFNNKVKAAAASLTRRLAMSMTAIGIASLKMSMDMNKGMANVATLIPKATERIVSLKTEVQKMAIETGTSTTVMSGGLYQVISAFGDTADTTKILEINAKAAKAGIASVTDSVNLTSAVMKGYNVVNAEGAQKASDLAFQTVKLGQTTFPELASSMGRVIPLAGQLGMTQEELFASFATLTGVTGNAAEVSTQMAGALRAMMKPTDNMKKAIKYLGYDSAKALVSEKGLIPTMQALVDITGGSEEKLTSMFGRMEPLVALFSLTGSQADTFTQKMKKMGEAAGATDEAFKVQTQGINRAGFKWDQFKIKLMVGAQQIGDRLIPTFERILGSAEDTALSIEGIADSIEIMLKPLEGIIWIAKKSQDFGESQAKLHEKNIQKFRIESSQYYKRYSVMKDVEGVAGMGAKPLPDFMMGRGLKELPDFLKDRGSKPLPDSMMDRGATENPMVGRQQTLAGIISGEIKVGAEFPATVESAEMETSGFDGNLGLNMGSL